MMLFTDEDFYKDPDKGEKKRKISELMDKYGEDRELISRNADIKDWYTYMFAEGDEYFDEVLNDRRTARNRSAFPQTPIPTAYYSNKNYINNIDSQEIKKTIDYTKYGEGFSEEMIDELENDQEFKQILNEYIIPNEGGYSNDIDDNGKETNMGISKATFSNENIKKLTRERANAIYYRDFYKWNGINKLPYKIRGFIVDYGAVTGADNAIKTIHRILNIPKGSIIGEVTLKKFENFNEDDYLNFLKSYRYEMIKYYKQASCIKNNKKYLQGWINRANRAHLAL